MRLREGSRNELGEGEEGGCFRAHTVNLGSSHASWATCRVYKSAQRRIESSGLRVDWKAAQGRSQLRQIQVQALQLAVRDAVIEQQARQRGVSLSVGDLDEAVAALERLAGGPDQLDQRLQMEGLSRADYLALLRYTLLDRKLRAADERWDEHLAAAVRAAGVQAFVGPCATDHRYPRCVDER